MSDYEDYLRREHRRSLRASRNKYLAWSIVIVAFTVFLFGYLIGAR